MGMTHSFITEWDNTPKTKMRFSREVSFAELQRVTNCMAKHEIPSIEDFIWVLKEAAKVLSTLPNNVHVIPEPNDRLIFVGDLHGCFETLIRLFLGYPQQNIPRTGFPGEIVDGRRLVYFFNGDFVDRGGSGYQIVFLLAYMAIACPGSCYLNRGNHESEMFGLSTQGMLGNKFMSEMAGKFSGMDPETYRPAIGEFFCALPIAHTIDRNIFMVHGGVPLGDDLSNVPRAAPQSYFSTGSPAPIPKGLKPYKISNLDNLTPSRQKTTNFEDNPRKQNELWHSFVWNYDRLPYSADFMEENNFKTMVHSHTATPFHQITSFLPLEKTSGEKYSIQSVIKNQEMFDRMKAFFASHQLANSSKLSILEIFSSPTNNGTVYAACVDAVPGEPGQRINYDPFQWTYIFLGNASEYNFIQQGTTY
ncbi:Serine/threonine protein phosphatase 7 [Giardia duodenalis]|uniref:Serine/threonine protein phosphatase 7 n=1 Tax=Giardia intestinalis (strain ATCC 50803 / WB clone C6) TaxID=184922 RepID=A8BSI3_GIAIC|nr:Serine/threonine protein phosphatase 7 [Giardia intestinalis]KAE8304712.1 Serine/threonine protein phosphatase 7 [Giardia intestinalis]|eukprot:XP_001705112.1 Serine/threonine protein phosphatase 7 [Giardia lamblia ATCC 50803]